MTTQSRSNAGTAGIDAGALVDPAWISDHLDDRGVRVVEVDVSPAVYQAGHIPGAALWNAYGDLRGRDYAPIDRRRFAALLSQSGVSPASTVVFYGYGAYLGFWLMRRYGHEDVRLMDGARERWAHDGHSWSRETPTFPRASYRRLGDDETVLASRETVAELIGCPDAVILDVRTDAEFRGERFWPSGATDDAGRAGHIPGAAHVPADLVRGADGTLRPPAQLRALYVAEGIGPDRQVVAYCTIGNRASQVWFVLRHLLGYPGVRVYYGSWVEWGKRSDTPIEARRADR